MAATLVAALVAVMSTMLLSQSLAASVSTGCTSAMMSLMPCLSYSSTSAKESTPSTKCCSALDSVVKTSPRCLCELLNAETLPLGITVNKTRAMELPGLCKVDTPPASKCSGEVAAEAPAAPTPPPAESGPKTKTPPATATSSQAPDMTKKPPPTEQSIAPTSSVPKGSKASQTASGGSVASPSSGALFLSLVAIAAASYV